MKVHSPSLPTLCADQIRRSILSGERLPGTKLPSERVLADQLGVNRVTLRAALAQLVATDLIEVKQGSGYTVRPYRQVGGPGLLPGLTLLAAEQGSLPEVAEELLRIRRYLALALVDRMVTELPDLTPVELAIASFAEVVREGGDSEALAEADAHILHTLLSVSDSVVLQLCWNPVRQVLAAAPALRDAMYRDPRANHLGWLALVAWLRAPTPDTAPLMALMEARDAATLKELV